MPVQSTWECWRCSRVSLFPYHSLLSSLSLRSTDLSSLSIQGLSIPTLDFCLPSVKQLTCAFLCIFPPAVYFPTISTFPSLEAFAYSATSNAPYIEPALQSRLLAISGFGRFDMPPFVFFLCDIYESLLRLDF
jgi:hypothetical protein